MQCTTRWCNNTDFSTWRAPANYAANTFEGEPFHLCLDCGAKWREARSYGLRDMHEAVKELRARTEYASPAGIVSKRKGQE